MPQATSTKKISIKLTKSPIGYADNQRRVIQALGLGKMNTVVIHGDSPTIRGMVHTVRHLVTVTDA